MAVTVSKKNIRDRLIDETIREIGKNGPGQISLRRIAAACGVTHATAYKHFENKQDLIATLSDAASAVLFPVSFLRGNSGERCRENRFSENLRRTV